MAASNDKGGSRRKSKPKPKPSLSYREAYGNRTTDSSRERVMERYGRTAPPKPRNRGGGGGGGGGAQAPDPASVPYVQMTPWQQAKADSNVIYGPALRQNAQLAAATPHWYDQYRAQVQNANTLYTNQSAPVIQQAQQAQQTAGQIAPGTEQDPDAVLAAQSRQALMGLGVTALQGIVNAQQGYFAGRAGPVAGAQQLQTQTALADERKGLVSDRQQYRVKRRGELRSQAHTERLENQAFGLEAYEAETDRRGDAAERRQARREGRRERRREGGEVNKYGYTERDWRGMSTQERQKVIRRFDNSTGSGGGSGFTPKQQSDARRDIRKGIEKVVGKLRGRTTAPANYWKQAYDALVGELDYDPVIARAIIQIVRDGKAKPGTMKTIRQDYGLAKLPRRKPFQLPDPYVLPDRPAIEPGDRPT